MKNIKAIAITLIASGIGLAASAQKINSKQVPAAVKSAFKTTYPAVKIVEWEKEKGNFEAGFKSAATEMSAVFKADGTLLESEMEISKNALPGGALTYIKQNYKGAAIKEAAKIIKASGEVNYEAEVKGNDLLFDSTGRFIKAVKD